MRIEAGNTRHPGFDDGAREWGRIARSLLLAVGLLVSTAALAAADGNANAGVRLAGHVLPVLAAATSLVPGSLAQDGLIATEQAQPLSLTLVLRRDDEAGFRQYLHNVYDPQSPIFRQFLSQTELSARFGPSPADYQQVLAYLQTQGFQLAQGSINRLTQTVRGSRAQVEQAFAVHIGDYQIGNSSFYANDTDPTLASAIAAHIHAIIGLANLATPRPMNQQVPPTCGGGTLIDGTTSPETGQSCPPDPCDVIEAGSILRPICKFFAPLQGLLKALGNIIPQAPGRANSAVQSPAFDGSGQTIGLLEFDSFHRQDVANFLNLTGLAANQIDHLTEVPVNGGATLGAGESEVLLDIDSVLILAPGANIAVYDGPSASSFQQLFNAIINGGATVISNSWAYCENETTLSDVQSLDAILQSAAASGISVFNGTGDSGSTCLDGSPDTIAVPADSPSATAVGGTSTTFGSGFTYGTESWWDGIDDIPTTGQGGFGTSVFFARPTYQNGANSSSMRSLPDVVVLADPADGISICQADAGGCPTGLIYGGTSLAAPIWSAIAALLNQELGINAGALNAAIYPLAGTGVFHDPAVLGSDFAHVGLGSPNLDRLYLALAQHSVGVPSSSASTVSADISFPPNFFAPAGPVPADGNSAATVAVRLSDANGNFISGKTITLTASNGNAIVTPPSTATSAADGAAVFSITDLTPEAITFTATDSSDALPLAQTAIVTFGVPSAAGGSIVAFTDAVPADGVSTDTITVALQDAQGRPTPGKLITLSQTGNSVISGPSPSVTGSNGQIAFTVTDTVQEVITYTATDITDGNLPVPGSAQVTFNASGGDNCGITNTGNPDISAGPGYAITPFATGFVPLDTNFGGLVDGCRGASGLAFDAMGNLYVSDVHSGNIYKFGPSGGSVGPATLITPTPLGPGIEDLSFGFDGKLYGAQNATTGDFFTGAVIEINPVTGALVRTVASSITCASFLKTDPLSGDLFVNDSCAGNGSENGSIWRISDPGSATPTTSVYAATPGVNGGLSFAPGGTLYMLSYRDNGGAGAVVSVTSTGSPTPGQVAVLPGITGPDLGISALGSLGDGDAESLVLAAAPGSDGFPLGIRSYDITTNPATTSALQMENGYANVEVVGPDGCMYVSMNVAAYKITNADGSCPLDSVQPLIALSPSIVSPDPAQGTPQTFTATFHNVSVPAGTPVLFQVSGANAQIAQTNAGADGAATLTYAGVNAGTDTLVAVATVNGTTLTSNPAQVTWNPGPHTTFLNLNNSLQSAFAGRPVTLLANLSDISVSPNAPVTGATIGFSVDGQSCSGVTAGNGLASCSLTVPDVGAFTLTVTYGGNGGFLPTSATEVFSTAPLSDVIFVDGFDGSP